MESKSALSSERNSIMRFNTTKLEFNDFTYTWVIEDFANFKFYDYANHLKSPVFIALNNGTNYQFQLYMYCDTDKYLTVTFQNSTKPPEKQPSRLQQQQQQIACLKLSIIDSSHKEIYVTEYFGYVYESPFVYNISKIGKISDVLTDRVLNKGNVTIRCRIRFHNRISHSQSGIDRSLLSIAPQPSILDDLKNLLESKKLSDMKLIVGNEEFQVHKLILAARSPVFSSMFETDMRENRENVVEINDISPEIMKEVLRFIYTDKANIESLPIMDLLAAADKYQIESLRVKCLELIMARLSVENVAEVLTIVDRYEIPELRKYVLHFLTSRRAEIAAKNNWDEMISSLSPSMLKELVKVLME